MRSFHLEINEQNFNLLWRAIHDRENTLVDNLTQEEEDSDNAALLNNDLIYLRLYKNNLEKQARAASFSEGGFSLDDGVLDLAKL